MGSLESRTPSDMFHIYSTLQIFPVIHISDMAKRECRMFMIVIYIFQRLREVGYSEASSGT